MRVLSILIGSCSILFWNSLSLAQINNQSKQFNTLKQTLTELGFTVKIAIPPHSNKYGIRPYGLVSGKDSTIWINPIVFELGNARSTLIHEAVHAAQLCAGNRTNFKLLNLDIEPPKITHPYFLRYHNYQREIEAEAYTVQVQANSLELANTLLRKNCSSGSDTP